MYITHPTFSRWSIHLYPTLTFQSPPEKWFEKKCTIAFFAIRFDGFTMTGFGIQVSKECGIVAFAVWVAIGMRQRQCLQTRPGRAPRQCRDTLFRSLSFPSRSHECAGSSVVDTRGDNINIMSRFRARQWEPPVSLLRDLLKGLGVLFRPAIHVWRFLWATWKMRLAYYLSPSFLAFLFGEHRGEAVRPLNILALHGVVFALV